MIDVIESLATLAVLGAVSEQPDPGQWVVHGGVLFLAVVAIGVIGYYTMIRGIRETDPGTRWALMIAFVILSPLVYFLNFGLAVQESKPVEFCNSCHVMDRYVKDLEDPKSEYLASMHYQYRWISDHQCYTCHSDYGLFGDAGAKLAGLRHYWKYYVGGYELPLKIRGTYDNKRCLHCHGPVVSYRETAEHQKNAPAIETNQMSCFGASCHVKTHPDPKEGAHADSSS